MASTEAPSGFSLRMCGQTFEPPMSKPYGGWDFVRNGKGLTDQDLDELLAEYRAEREARQG